MGDYEKIYGPLNQRLSMIAEYAMYFARDSIMLSEAIQVNVGAEFNANIIDVKHLFDIAAGALVKMTLQGCDPNE
ncbi:hypothetical protein [Portibacter marinus]|uniref:hypothetical protein n=1 Tax=Portibacter marinus TaxID=2898660 RepID=UPI001F3264CE|nr:hypothetical protein [Portibacter marinus]